MSPDAGIISFIFTLFSAEKIRESLAKQSKPLKEEILPGFTAIDKIKQMPDIKTDSKKALTNFNEDIEIAREALVNLGYAQNDINHVLNELKTSDLTLEELVKESLKRLL